MRELSLCTMIVCLAACENGGGLPAGRDPLTHIGGAVVGLVRDPSGAPLPDVEVRGPGELRTRSDARGAYALANVPPTRELVLAFEKAGMSSSYRRVTVLRAEVVTANAVLGPALVRTVERVEDGVTLERGNVRVIIPEGAVVDPAGAPVTGPIDVTMATIDPTTSEMATSPSDFKAVRTGGAVVGLETFGMVEVRLRRGDVPLNLAPGKPARVEMRIPRGMPEGQTARAGDSIPLWWLNPSTATWEEQGAGGVTQTAEGLLWTATVPHFSWWNCDQAFVLTCIEGYVEDCFGNPVPNAQVVARGLSYRGDTYSQTDARGFYRIWPVRTSARVEVAASGVVAGKEMAAPALPVQTPATPLPEGATAGCGDAGTLAMPIPALSAQVTIAQSVGARAGVFDQATAGNAVFFEAQEDAASCAATGSVVDTCTVQRGAKPDDAGSDTLDGGEQVELVCENGKALALDRKERDSGEVVYEGGDLGMSLEEMNLDVRVQGSAEVEPIDVVAAVKMPERLEAPELTRPATPARSGHVTWMGSKTGRGRVRIHITAQDGTTVSCNVLDDGSFDLPADAVAALPRGAALLEVRRVRARYFAAGRGIGLGVGASVVTAALSLE